jgi:large subunit ribosomal protein L15
MDLKSVCSKGIKHEERVRVGRGLGSGLGKTAGRGHKGWGARSGAYRRAGYEGGQMPFYRRVPKRGFTNARFRVDFTVINVSSLGDFADGSVVDLDAVVKAGLVGLEAPRLKVLGGGELKRKLTVRAAKFSKSAAEKIQAAGGEVVVLDSSCATEPEGKAEPKSSAEPKNE